MESKTNGYSTISKDKSWSKEKAKRMEVKATRERYLGIKAIKRKIVDSETWRKNSTQKRWGVRPRQQSAEDDLPF